MTLDNIKPNPLQSKFSIYFIYREIQKKERCYSEEKEERKERKEEGKKEER